MCPSILYFVFILYLDDWFKKYFACLRMRGGGHFNGRPNKCLLIWSSEHTFIYKLFWSSSIFGGIGRSEWILWSGRLCYISAYSSNLMFLIPFDPSDSLLQLNYLPNIVIDHACFFTWLDMSLSVKTNN